MGFQIHVNKIQKNFGEIKALIGVDDFFESGKLHGLIGPEGAGKTTLLRNLMGLLLPNSGNIVFYENSNVVPFRSIKNKISYMPQRQSLYPDLSIEEHLHFFKSLYGLEDDDFESKSKVTKVAWVCEVTGTFSTRYLSNSPLSSGLVR